MNDIPDKWKIDRIPTERERKSTIIFSSFLSILFGFLSILFAWMLVSSPETREKQNIYFFIGVTVLFIICIYVLVRAIRAKYEKLSAFKAKLIGYLILVISIAFIPMALLGRKYDNKFYLLALSFTGIPMGISIIKQGKSFEKRT